MIEQNNIRLIIFFLLRNTILVLHILWWDQKPFLRRFWMQTALIQRWRSLWSRPSSPSQRGSRTNSRGWRSSCKKMTCKYSCIFFLIWNRFKNPTVLILILLTSYLVNMWKCRICWTPQNKVKNVCTDIVTFLHVMLLIKTRFSPQVVDYTNLLNTLYHLVQ